MARWYGQPDQNTTGVASAPATHCQPSNISTGTIEIDHDRQPERDRDQEATPEVRRVGAVIRVVVPTTPGSRGSIGADAPVPDVGHRRPATCR